MVTKKEGKKAKKEIERKIFIEERKKRRKVRQKVRWDRGDNSKTKSPDI